MQSPSRGREEVCQRGVAWGRAPAAPRARLSSPGPLEFCDEIPVEPGRVYDFFLVFDGGRPAVLWSVQDLPAAGQCPPAVKEYSGSLDGVCGGGAPGDSSGWSEND